MDVACVECRTGCSVESVRGTPPTSASKCLSVNLWLHLDSHWKRRVLFTEYTALFICDQNEPHWQWPNWFIIIRQHEGAASASVFLNHYDYWGRCQMDWQSKSVASGCVFLFVYICYLFVYLSLSVLVARVCNQPEHDLYYLTQGIANSWHVLWTICLSWTKYQPSHFPLMRSVVYLPQIMYWAYCHPCSSILYTVLHQVSSLYQSNFNNVTGHD